MVKQSRGEKQGPMARDGKGDHVPPACSNAHRSKERATNVEMERPFS